MFFRPNFYRLGSGLRKTLGSGSAINALGSIFPIKRMWIRITWCFRIQCMRIRIQVRIMFHLDPDSGGKKAKKNCFQKYLLVQPVFNKSYGKSLETK